MPTQTAPLLLPHRETFRAAHRARRPASILNGWNRFYFVLALGAVATLACAALVRDPQPWEWACLPAGFLIANFVEYLAHRHPFFTADAMESGPDDFDAVLFSPLSLAAKRRAKDLTEFLSSPRLHPA